MRERTWLVLDLALKLLLAGLLAFGALLLLRLGVGPWTALVLVTGVGATLAILWELAEYFSFIRGEAEEATAYTDTLGDEVLGRSGAFVAGVATGTVARRRSSGVRLSSRSSA